MSTPTVAEAVKMLREVSGESQLHFGHMIGAAQGTVTDWERGKGKPAARFLVNLATFARQRERHDLVKVFIVALETALPGVTSLYRKWLLSKEAA